MSKTIGNFEVYAATGGYPVWCTIRYTNKEFRMGHGQDKFNFCHFAIRNCDK
jgi:hypothetical protein